MAPNTIEPIAIIRKQLEEASRTCCTTSSTG